MLAHVLANAQHGARVPGRKTDVKDAEWLAELLRHGHDRRSFVPDKQQRELRDAADHELDAATLRALRNHEAGVTCF